MLFRSMVGPRLFWEARVIILQRIALMKQLTVGSPQNQQVTLPPGHAASCHDTLWGCLARPPGGAHRLVFPKVVQKAHPFRGLSPPTQNIETVLISVVLSQGEVEGTRPSWNGRENLPLEVGIFSSLRQVQGP